MSSSVTDLNVDLASLTGAQLIARAAAIVIVTAEDRSEAAKLIDLAHSAFEREMGHTTT